MPCRKTFNRITLVSWNTIAVILVIWSIVLHPAEADALFYPAVNYDTAYHPFSVDIGDLNGDGDLDLAVANEVDDNVSVLLGNGDGTLQSAVNYGAASRPRSVAIGDLNGDANLDLAVANEGGDNVSVLLGNGDGSFQSALNYGAGLRPHSVAIGDLNGDGDPDLAVANAPIDNVSVLIGNGDGSFQSALNYGTGEYPISVAIDDLNADANLDLAVANYSSDNVSVLLGNGDGTFQSAANYNTGGGPHSVAIGDLNGDGDPDLAVANWRTDDVSVLLGNGDGSFQGEVNYGTDDTPLSIAIGDLNADGELDLAVTNGAGNVSVLLGNGDGTFQSTVNYGTGNMPRSVAIGDLYGDGYLDLAVANEASNNVSVLINTTGLNVFGIEVGNRWSYQGTHPGGAYIYATEVVAEDQTTFSPVNTYAVEHRIDGILAGTNWYERTFNELKFWGEDFGDFYGFSDGLLVAWYPMQVGDWRYSSATVPIEGLVFGVSMTVDVLIRESIDVGFDTLEAYKVRYILRISGHGLVGSTTYYYWVVPYLGFVKYQDADLLEVLNDFAIGGGAITPTTDADGDDLNDYEELIIYETDWQNSDTDDDGLSDGDEVNTYGTEPNDSDSDKDGLNDGDEVNTHGTDPNNEDTDNDGLSDFEEINTYNTDPNNEDTDGDELSDGDEIAIGTDPLNPDTDEDGMPDGWEDDHDLDPLVDDAAGDPDGDGLTNLEEYNLGRHPTNVEPDAPLLYLPTDNEIMVSLTPQLETQNFSDTDGDFHAHSQWQIGKQIGNPEPCTEESFTNSDYIVYDGTSDTQLTLFNVPDLLLDPDTNYCWRARFTDTGGATSEWAEPFSFSTIDQSEDDQDPQNGIPDDQEADCLGIFDPDEIPANTLCVDTLVGNAQVGIEPSSNVVSIDAFKSVDPKTIPESLPAVKLLMGLMSFKAEVDQVGDTMAITYHSSVPMPEGAKCYKYDPVNGWQDYSAHIVSISPDRKSITLEYKDGDYGDLDGVANKFVIDPVGFGVGVDSEGRGYDGGGGGGGGCFVSTIASGFNKSSEIAALALLFSFLFMGLSSLRNMLKK